ncbi:transmembrane protein 194A-like protein [Leptotrombidium deliense]|uniref:Transmembrane protein 194A-like protein n=1 Tax=Leptotrombidium deliense TaxID=299467 RepID=A0A443SDB8_9ACAR|nr:transmembrane protein 194A-like protein [Leptotrombidium deliense]
MSFAYAYKQGPITNPRSLDLVRWALQFAGFSIIFLSSEFYECTLTLTAITLIVFYFPKFKLLSPFRKKNSNTERSEELENEISEESVVNDSPQVTQFKSSFSWASPPITRSFLNEEEYRKVVQRETKNSLKHLRSFCSSSNNEETWALISKLNDPKRFAKFVFGDNHVSPREYEEYNSMPSFEFKVDELKESDQERYDDDDISSHASEVTAVLGEDADFIY